MHITSVGEVLFDIYPTHKKLGGAPLNFIYHINKIIGNGNIISRIGKDVLGEKVLAELKRYNLSAQFVQIDSLHPTGAANVTLNDAKEPEFELDTERAYDFIELTDEAVDLITSDTNCLYFGTLAQRNETSRSTINSFFNKGLKYFCDLNLRQSFYNEDIVSSSLQAANILKVNYKELQTVHKLLLQGEYNTETSSLELMERFDLKMLAVTRGEDGTTIFENGKRHDYSNNDSVIVDTTGAGDAFSAVLCIGYLQGWELPLINKYSNDFALEICKIDGAIPKNDRLYEELINLAAGF